MQPLFIAGPCVIENMELLETVAEKLVSINKRLSTEIIFKASFDKANRTSINGPRGVGIDEGMKTFDEIKKLYAENGCGDISCDCDFASYIEAVDDENEPTAFLIRC